MNPIQEIVARAQAAQAEIDEILATPEGGAVPGQADPTAPVELDGYLYDPATGECLGPADGQPEQWRPTDLKGAAWVLRKRGKAQRRLQDLREAMSAEIREEVDRITREFDACIRRAETQAGWWSRYDEDLAGITTGELVDSRAKSIAIGAWRMGFRRAPGRIDVLDEHLALAWAKAHCQDAVVVKESIAKRPLKGREEELPGEAFAVVEPEDRFYIEEVKG